MAGEVVEDVDMVRIIRWRRGMALEAILGGFINENKLEYEFKEGSILLCLRLSK